MYSNERLGDFITLLSSRFIFIFLIVFFLLIAAIVISIIANWILFNKAGKEGWKSIIPFYNCYVLVEIAGLNWWWFLLVIAPNIAGIINPKMADIAGLASTFALFNCYYNISKKFRKDTTIAVLSGIFPFIFMFIFAFSKKDYYYSNEKVSANGIFPDDTSTSTTSTRKSSNAYSSEEVKLKYCSKCGCKMDDYDKFCAVCGEKYEQK